MNIRDPFLKFQFFSRQILKQKMKQNLKNELLFIQFNSYYYCTYNDNNRNDACNHIASEFDDCISKPLDVSEFIIKLEKYCIHD